MTTLDETLGAAQQSQGGTRTMLGTARIVVDQQGVQQSPVVTVGGSVIPVRWAGPVVVEDGDTVLVQIASERGAQATGLVLQRVMETSVPQAGTVKSVPSGSQTITVTALWLGDIACAFVGGAPSVGDTVMLLWQGSTPVAIGKKSTTPTAGGGRDPGGSGGGGQSGVTTVRAIDSATWDDSRSGWNSYYGANVWSGQWGSYGPLHGAYFYGGGAAGLAGRTIAGLRIRLGARRRAGNYNAAASLALATHGSSTRGGAPTATGGSGLLSIPVNAGPGWYDLPADWGPRVAAGGGIVFTGGDYLGINGIGEDPESGLLEFTWRS